jgi:MFS family permease
MFGFDTGKCSTDLPCKLLITQAEPTGSIGPVTVMPQFKDAFDPISPTLQGLIVSAILITASIASLVAGPLSDKISRTRTFALGGLIFAIGSMVECASFVLPMLIVGRCIAGVGEGLFLSTITVYVCEIAPTAIRGSLACTVQLYITIGIATGELCGRCSFEHFMIWV